MCPLLLYSIGEESYSSGTRPPLTDSPRRSHRYVHLSFPFPLLTYPGLSHPNAILPFSLPKKYETDGTTNFVHGYPYACISTGLVDVLANSRDALLRLVCVDHEKAITVSRLFFKISARFSDHFTSLQTHDQVSLYSLRLGA